jgi:hypothetical protein
MKTLGFWALSPKKRANMSKLSEFSQIHQGRKQWFIHNDSACISEAYGKHSPQIDSKEQKLG